MNKKIRTIILLSTACAMMACSNDGKKDEVDKPHQDQKVECGSTTCASGQQCVSDKCVVFVEAGEACDETDNICHKGKCESSKCVEVKGACTIQSDCDTGGTCTEGKCILKEGESCANSTAECVDSICHEGKCSTAVPCETQDDCKEIGYCNEEKKICSKLPSAGETCTESYGCQGNMECYEGKCYDNEVQIGEDCNDYLNCESGECIDGKCRTMVIGNQKCDEYIYCPGEQVCDSGKCIETHGECNIDEDCGTDSYCCMEDACSQKHVCYPYGEGPRGEINEECMFDTVEGMFEASIQCDWAYTTSNQDASTVLAADTPFDSGDSSELIARIGNHIRIFNAENCQELQAISDTEVGSGADQISLGDIDGDGKIEILSNSHNKVKAYRWDESKNGYVDWWTATECGGKKAWGGASIHDINGDGKPEILYQQYVLRGEDGKCLNPSQQDTGFGGVTIAGDLDVDGAVEAITQNGIVRWDTAKNEWVKAYDIKLSGETYAFADFGTPGEKPEDFDFTNFDGIAEIVSSNPSVDIVTLSGQVVMHVAIDMSGAPTIGDFDNDGKPEIAIGGKNTYSVYDPLCTKKDENCANPNTLWTITSQDADNTVASSSLFDFDGDGQTEVVYSDECFTRILDGKTGDVLFSSYRMSKIDREYPTIADFDNDEAVEIALMANSVAPGCSPVDELHHGVRCVVDSDCFSNSCVDGYCRCKSDNECNWQYDSTGKLMQQYQCTTPLAPQKASDGNVCRAYHRNGDSHQGIVVLRDRLDRWVSSRSIWNQHAFSITNVNDDGSIPALASWLPNFRQPKMNNYRKNVEGKRGANTAPDITGKFTESGNVCKASDGKVTLNAEVCNRGTKMVASKMPATFYQVKEDGTKVKLCTSYTTKNVPIGNNCLPVSCEVSEEVTGEILLVVNDDGNGGKTTVECNESNNTATTKIVNCIN